MLKEMILGRTKRDKYNYNGIEVPENAKEFLDVKERDDMELVFIDSKMYIRKV